MLDLKVTMGFLRLPYTPDGLGRRRDLLITAYAKGEFNRFSPSSQGLKHLGLSLIICSQHISEFF